MYKWWEGEKEEIANDIDNTNWLTQPWKIQR